MICGGHARVAFCRDVYGACNLGKRRDRKGWYASYVYDDVCHPGRMSGICEEVEDELGRKYHPGS